MTNRRGGTICELIATEFVFQNDWQAMDTGTVVFRRMNSPFYKGEKWVARRGSSCLTRDGKWEYEPTPSSRDDDFYARCRFDSLEQAVAIFNKSNKENAR